MQVFAKRVIKNRPSVTRNSGKSLLPKQGFSVGLADAFSWCHRSGRRCRKLVSWEEQWILFICASSADRHFHCRLYCLTGQGGRLLPAWGLVTEHRALSGRPAKVCPQGAPLGSPGCARPWLCSARQAPSAPAFSFLRWWHLTALAPAVPGWGPGSGGVAHTGAQDTHQDRLVLLLLHLFLSTGL